MWGGWGLGYRGGVCGRSLGGAFGDLSLFEVVRTSFSSRATVCPGCLSGSVDGVMRDPCRGISRLGGGRFGNGGRYCCCHVDGWGYSCSGWS